MTLSSTNQVRWTISDLEGLPELKLYSVEGVAEYWICDRPPQTVEIYQREAEILRKTRTLFATDTLTSPLLPEFQYPVQSFFE